MRQIMRRRGRFVLIRSEEGYSWTMPGPEGIPWYWHPDKSHWTGRPCARPTPERASEGLNPDAPLAAGAVRHLAAPQTTRSDEGGLP